MTNHKTAIQHKETHELLGYVAKDSTSWLAQTIFHYTIERTTSPEDAERIVRERGLAFLMGTWNYFDKDEREWFPCVIKEAYEHRVIVIRTNVMGYQDPDTYKVVTIANPSEDKLVKIS